MCTHLIHNWHGSSLRPGKQCKAKQRNDSNKVRPHFAGFYFPFYFTFLFRHFFFSSFPSVFSFDFFNYIFFLLSFFLFISVNFLRHALSISCSLSLLLLCCCFRSCCLYKVQRRNVEPLLPLNAIYMRQSADAAPASASCVCRSHNSNTRSSARKLRFVIVTLSLFSSLSVHLMQHTHSNWSSRSLS